MKKDLETKEEKIKPLYEEIATTSKDLESSTLLLKKVEDGSSKLPFYVSEKLPKKKHGLGFTPSSAYAPSQATSTKLVEATKDSVHQPQQENVGNHMISLK